MNLFTIIAGAGEESVGEVAKELGFQVFSFCIDEEDDNYPASILKFDTSKVPFKPDVIWASPPCKGFSVASIRFHWTGGRRAYIPKTETAKLGIKIAKKVFAIIEYFNPQFYFVENPRGVLRKMPFIQEFQRRTITYCQYGDNRMKPTDIWTNSNKWQPRPMCKKGDYCHQAAPRGSRTGTQGRKNGYERSRIPRELCLEIFNSCK